MYDNWEQLKSDCMGCMKCELGKTRTKLVFGVGNENAKVLFIGEGPGANEDLQGEPFVGRGGQLLDKFLAAVDLDRKKNIYIANMVKCRPPQNRDPLPAEQEMCIGWLREQTRLLKPKIIVCLGRISATKLISMQSSRNSSIANGWISINAPMRISADSSLVTREFSQSRSAARAASAQE